MSAGARFPGQLLPLCPRRNGRRRLFLRRRPALRLFPLKGAPRRPRELFRASLPGFALRVSGPPTAKPGQPQIDRRRQAWVYYSRHDGKLKVLTFEPSYPALGLADARQKADEAEKALKAGDDPAQLRAEAAAATKERKRHTVAAVFDEFEGRQLQGQKRSAPYVTATRRNFDRDLRPFAASGRSPTSRGGMRSS